MCVCVCVKLWYARDGVWQSCDVRDGMWQSCVCVSVCDCQFVCMLSLCVCVWSVWSYCMLSVPRLPVCVYVKFVCVCVKLLYVKCEKLW